MKIVGKIKNIFSEGAPRPTAGDACPERSRREPREFFAMDGIMSRSPGWARATTSRGEGGRVPPFIEKLPFAAMEKDVLIRLSALGDVILTIPTVRELMQSDRTVHWVIGKKLEAMAPFLPGIKHVLPSGIGPFFSRIFPLVKTLRKLDAKRVVDLQGKPASFFLSSLLGVPVERYWKRTLAEQGKVSGNNFPLRFEDERPVWKKFGEVAGVALVKVAPELTLSSDYLREAQDFLTKWNLLPGKYLLFHPEASYRGKTMPDKLLNAFIARNPTFSVLIGDRKTVTASGNFLDLRGETTLRQLPGLMHYSRGVISTDSGPMHLARATNVPVCAFFFQTDPCLGFSPVPGETVRVFSRDLPCKPCSLHGQRYPCPAGNWQCKNWDLKDSSEEVFAFLKQFD